MMNGCMNIETSKSGACKEIIEKEIVPLFKNREFYKGIESGISALIQLLESQRIVPPPSRSGKA